MIEEFNFSSEKWIKCKVKTLKELVKVNSRKDHPCKIYNTNQESFDNAYFYITDCMGHDFWYRMTDEDFQIESHDADYMKQQREDYTMKYMGKKHLICGMCRRCKHCKDCKCEDKHIGGKK